MDLVPRSSFVFKVSSLLVCCLLPVSAQVRPPTRGRTRLADKVAAAKKSGKQTLELRTSSGMLPMVGSAAEALAGFTVIVGTPISKETQIEPATDLVSTWYKFQVFDRLTKRASTPLAPRLDKLPDWERPGRLLPINENEVVIGKMGGSLVVDGVTVTATEPDFPDPLMGHIYLMFISESDDRLAIFEMGAAGVYEVIGDQLSPVGDKKHPVVTEIKNLYRNSLATLKSGASG